MGTFPNLEGRPSSYTDDVPQKVSKYADKCLKEKRLPTRAGLSNYIGISKDTLIKWGRENKHLLDALNAFDQLQEDEVWDKALKGEYNSNIAKLMLHNHGYSDRSQVDQSIDAKVKVDDLSNPQDKLKALKDKIAQHEQYLKGDDSA